MATDLSKVGKRDELKARREPYWQRLRAGCYLGFRPSLRGGAGTWIARAYDADASKYRVKSLGDFGTLVPNERFAAAKREAEKLAELVEAGGRFAARSKPSPMPAGNMAKPAATPRVVSSGTSMGMLSPR